MPPHDRDELLHEGGVDLGVSLPRDISEHADDEVATVHQLIDVGELDDGASLDVEVRVLDRELVGIARECPRLVPAGERQRYEVLSCSARCTEDEER